jgi:DNA-directed RNA polymerase I subunit RPA2
MQALVDTSDWEIGASLTCCYSDKHGNGKGVVGTELIGERTQIILDEVRALSLITRKQCLVHIGSLI